MNRTDFESNIPSDSVLSTENSTYDTDLDRILTQILCQTTNDNSREDNFFSNYGI